MSTLVTTHPRYLLSFSGCFSLNRWNLTKELGKLKPRLYNKNTAPWKQNIRSRTCPVTFQCLTAAVLWPCEGSIIICPIIEGLYEWFDEGFAVSALNHWNLFSRWRNLDSIERQEDPIELENYLRVYIPIFIYFITLENFSWGDQGTIEASFFCIAA